MYNNVANTTDLVFPIKPWLLTCYAILAFAGIIGNILVLLVLAYNASIRRSSFGVYIGGLAMADLFVALSGIPVYVLSTGNFKNHPTGDAGAFMCKIITGYNIMFYFAVVSVYTLLAVTLERYFSICRPQSNLAVASGDRAKKVIIGIWMWSFIIRINAMIGEDYAEPSEAQFGAHCKFSITFHHKITPKVIYSMIFIMQYIIPVSLMIFSFSKIRRELLRQNEYLLDAGAGNIQNDELLSQLRMREKTVNTIIWVIVAYFILWSPNQFLYFCYNLLDLWHTTWNSNLIQSSVVLYFVTCAVNPVIYALRSKMFRDGFAATFKCIYCFGERRRQHYEDISDVTGENVN